MILDALKERRRRRQRAAPVPTGWREIVGRNVPLFAHLPPADQEELLGHVQVFLAEKHVEGAGGLALTDEIRVTIAAQACVLLLHRETDYYPRLKSIIVYPSGYVAPAEHEVEGGIWVEEDEHLVGHTEERLGALVLAWDAARHTAGGFDDGDNLVLHEFAHQLDFEDGVTDGTPRLDSRHAYRAWARVMDDELEALREAEARGEETVLDQYGAENPAEFFAVATEAFFERPHALKADHPALYDQLARFYRQDPAALLPPEPADDDEWDEADERDDGWDR